jgi:hypothetical protein
LAPPVLDVPRGWPRLVGWHDVDERLAGAKLCQFTLPQFQGQSEHIEVKSLERRRICCAQYDVINPNNLEGCGHGKLLFSPPTDPTPKGSENGVGKSGVENGGAVACRQTPNAVFAVPQC